MRVIARATLSGFVRNRVETRKRSLVRSQLDAWYAQVSRAVWQSPAELKQQFGSASIVSRERVIFNIKGNEYRLVVAINYEIGVLMIKWIGTHAEYDRIKVGEVSYDKARYVNPPS